MQKAYQENNPVNREDVIKSYIKYAKIRRDTAIAEEDNKTAIHFVREVYKLERILRERRNHEHKDTCRQESFNR